MAIVAALAGLCGANFPGQSVALAAQIASLPSSSLIAGGAAPSGKGSGFAGGTGKTKPATTPALTPSTAVVNLSLSPATANVLVGQSFSESLLIDTGTDKVSAAEIHLSFDPARLQVQAFTAAGTLMPVVLEAGKFDNAAGTASIVLGSSPSTPATGTGTLATIGFMETAAGSTSITYANGTLTASIGQNGNTLNTATGATINPSSAPVVLLSQPTRLADTRSAGGGGPIDPALDRCFTVGGQNGIPADAAGAVLNVTAVGQTANGWLTLYPAGQTRPATSTLNFGSIEYAIANGAIVRVGTGGQVCVTAGQTAAQVILDATGYIPAAGAAQMPLLTSPVRLVDTRSGPGGAVQPGADRCFTLAGQGGIPVDAAGVLLNVTAVGYTGNGWLTAYPGGQALPGTSTLNYDAREYAIANNALVKLGNGQVCVDAGQASAHAILDAVGYITADGLAQAPLLANPQRLVDTRSQNGAVQPGTDRCFTLSGASGIPANAVGLLVNVTAVGYTNNGWLTLYPAGQLLPATSTLNFDRHEYAIANGAIVRLGTGGQVCVNAGQTSAQVIIDVTGYLPASASAASSGMPRQAASAVESATPQPRRAP